MTDEEIEKRADAFLNKDNKEVDEYLDTAGAKENAQQWHYPSKGELPDTKEDERILFFVKDTHDYDGSPYQHFALGFYKAISYKGGKKMFSEQSKGYSCDFLPEEVIAWQYLPEPPREEYV